MLHSLDELKNMFSGCIIEISDVGYLIEELDCELDGIEDAADIDENELYWVTALKDFYKKVSCYGATVLVSEFHRVDYFMEFVCDLVDECPEAVRPFIDVRGLAKSMSDDLTVFEIKYTDWHVDSECWYLI